jgi:NTP pyrophosphatase (non-canonical NTP hydrolase)
MSETNSTTKGEIQSLDDLAQLIFQWALDRNLLNKENVKSQMLKVVEEIGETARAINKGDMLETVDGIGDSLVTLFILSFQLGLSPQFCLSSAYTEIANRKGKTINGTFIKE